MPHTITILLDANKSGDPTAYCEYMGKEYYQAGWRANISAVLEHILWDNGYNAHGEWLGLSDDDFPTVDVLETPLEVYGMAVEGYDILYEGTSPSQWLYNQATVDVLGKDARERRYNKYMAKTHIEQNWN